MIDTSLKGFNISSFTDIAGKIFLGLRMVGKGTREVVRKIVMLKRLMLERIPTKRFSMLDGQCKNKSLERIFQHETF